MIAFLDAEYNCNREDKDSPYDTSIIDVSLVVVNENKNYKIVEKFQAYVKPTLCDGKISWYIQKLTGITQAKINSEGIKLEDAMSTIKEMITKYGVSKIYVFGNNDLTAFRWNAKTYDVKDCNVIANKFCDISKSMMQTFGFNSCVSLEYLAYMCNVDYKSLHSSMTDTMILYYVYRVFKGVDEVNKDRFRVLKKYIKLRESYGKICGFAKSIRSCGIEPDEFFQMAIKGEKFIDFKKFSEMYVKPDNCGECQNE